MIWILEDDAGNALEVWPALGFNAFRWSAHGREMLFRSPAFFEELRPSRSGWPILFPFPNRIRDGRYTWGGRAYALPCNDPAGKNAIHGFVHTAAWNVLDSGTGSDEAWITADVRGTRDAPESVALWPSDYELRVTYRLGVGDLRVEAVARNPGPTPLPWGLGYHPYFRLEPFGGNDALVQTPAHALWQLDDCLPDGRKTAPGAERDLRSPRRFGDLRLDDAYSDLAPLPGGVLGVLEHPRGAGRFTLRASPEFREMVIFTPPHREAICLEPYTCVSDAIHLQANGVDAGWRELPPGHEWRGDVHCRAEFPM
jgi:aldose 1-epimerase